MRRVQIEERATRHVLRVQRRLGELEHRRHARVERLVHARPLVASALAKAGRDAFTELGEAAGAMQRKLTSESRDDSDRTEVEETLNERESTRKTLELPLDIGLRHIIGGEPEAA